MDMVTDVEYEKDYPSLGPTHDYSGENEPVFPEKPVDEDYKRDSGAAQPLDPRIQLNYRQELAVEMIMGLVRKRAASTSQKAGIVMGRGGTGKSTVITDVEYKMEEEYGKESVLKLATSGVAAKVIGGSTAHSSKRGVALPVKTTFKKLKGKNLRHLQTNYAGKLRLVILDEFSMLKQKELYYLDQRLRQIMGKNIPFGGVAVILFGDPGQLPAIGGTCLWYPNPKYDDDKAGQILWELCCKNVMELLEVNRIIGDPDAALYLQIMDA